MTDILHKADLIDFKTLADDAPVNLWLTNPSGENIFTNNKYKNFIGRKRVDKMGGKAWFSALHPDDREYCLEVFNDAFETHKAFKMEYRIQGRDGEYHHFFDRGEPYIDSDGRFAGFVGSSTDISEQKNYEEELQRSHNELTQYNQEMSLVNQLNSYLQVCRSMDETYPVISFYAEQIFPKCSGALYLFNEQKSLVEAMATWGKEPLQSTPIILPDDCWALRQGREHASLADDNRMACKHLKDGKANYICEPIIAQGEMLGIIHIEFDNVIEQDPEQQNFLQSRQRLIKITADNLALSLVSLKLREALKAQSVRDPMTSLFNRRYMEESLEREIHRCNREKKGLGIIMIDIDHFKKFNDNYGHDAGDLVLTNVAQHLVEHFRTSDIICRYGGEELIVIMPATDKQHVVSRAEKLCKSISELTIDFHGKPLPTITASFGVSHKKDNIEEAAKLIKSADIALYKAKDNGRNQVVVA